MTDLAHRPAAVGAPVPRKEDAALVTGRATWTDNLTLPGMTHMAILRSPMAHARLVGVDVSAALQRPGVVAAFSGDDLADQWQSGLPTIWKVSDDMLEPPHWPLARDKVRHVGDAVAAVIARDRGSAVDALEHIVVDYDPLDAVVDIPSALTDEVLVHDDIGTNRCFTYHWDSGNVDEVFSAADVVIRRRIVNQRLIPTAIEPRAVVAAPAAGEYTLWSATQVPHIVRFALSGVLGIDEQKLRVVAPDVGGGFGSKLNVYAEEALALAVARRLGRPVKWTETRSENYQATIHGRDHLQDLELAATRDGRVLGFRADVKVDLGAYLQFVTTGTPVLGAFMYPGIYKMDAHSLTIAGVFSTKTPTDAYRGAGRPEATFAIERMMDELAVELDMDPIRLRRRNWIPHEEFPFESITGRTYDSGNYEAATDRALELFGYEDLRREQQRRRDAGDRVQLGIGISTYTEMCGLAPSRVLGQLGYRAGGWESASIRLLPTGKAEVVTGTSPHGQGHETSWSQIVADALGLDPDDIVVHHGDTKVSAQGLDTYGSRSLTVGGVALHRAAERLVERLKKVAAHQFEASEDDITFERGRFGVRGSPESSTTTKALAMEVFTGHDLPDGMEPSLHAESTFDPENFSFPHGTHLCAVEVDTETGRPTILRYVAVDDIGNVVNPQIVEGQVHGGLAQGIAQALYEQAVYDTAGNLVTGTCVDYYVPGAPDLPEFTTDRTVTPATTNPLGVKGVGEAGTIASTPAVVNAVLDAIRHLGATDVEMPCTPERVWRAIMTGRGHGGAAAHASQRGGMQ